MSLRPWSPSGTDDLDSLEEDTEVSVKCPAVSDPSPKNSFDVRMQDAENPIFYDKLAKLNRREAHTIKVPPVKTLLAQTRILPQPSIGLGRVLTNPFNIPFPPPSNCVTEASKDLKLTSGPDLHKIDVKNEDSAADHIIKFLGWDILVWMLSEFLENLMRLGRLPMMLRSRKLG